VAAGTVGPGSVFMGTRIVAYDGRVTVAAVILFPGIDDALADTAGRPAVRRIVESAWAGGATPIVVVAADEGGRVASALAGSPAVLAEPAPADHGPVGQIVRGIRVAAEQVTETDAALIWPGRMVWADAETTTTLIETHGLQREALLRPLYDDRPGWPVLLPLGMLSRLEALPVARTPEQLLEDLRAAGIEFQLVDTGDPGVAHDIATAIDELPEFEGPRQPVKTPPEWGAAAADMGDEGPLQGPHLAPYAQAAEEGE
jgi:CTP:molybdopterin cytidylyltransferase MocA